MTTIVTLSLCLSKRAIVSGKPHVKRQNLTVTLLKLTLYSAQHNHTLEMDFMQWPEPRSFDVNLETGLMDGTDTRYQKRLADLDGLYADAVAFSALASSRGNDVVYDVTDHRPSDQPGDLITGVTRMSPGKVGDEYFMTRGHIHANIDRPELYFG